MKLCVGGVSGGGEQLRWPANAGNTAHTAHTGTSEGGGPGEEAGVHSCLNVQKENNAERLF